MRKFGGSGRKKQCCRYRKCNALKSGTCNYNYTYVHMYIIPSIELLAPASDSALKRPTTDQSEQGFYQVEVINLFGINLTHV